MKFKDNLPEEVQVFDQWIKKEFSEEINIIIDKFTYKRGDQMDREYSNYDIKYTVHVSIDLIFNITFRENILYIDTPNIDTNGCLINLGDILYEISNLIKYLEEEIPISKEEMEKELSSHAL